MKKIGDRVRAERPEGAKVGSWPAYDGKLGTVVGFNDGEIGVRFTASRKHTAWFRPNELTLADAVAA